MKITSLLIMTILGAACSSPRSTFVKEKVCSSSSLKYLQNPRNLSKNTHYSEALMKELARTRKDMQLCYEDLKDRTGVEEFNTCLVVGVDDLGRTEFYNLSSDELRLDQQFLECVAMVTKSVPYSKLGRNYMFLQAYAFYLKK